jgi:hypothetical protein
MFSLRILYKQVCRYSTYERVVKCYPFFNTKISKIDDKILSIVLGRKIDEPLSDFNHKEYHDTILPVVHTK